MKVFTQVLTEALAVGVSYDSVSLSFDERKRGRLKITTAADEQVGIQIERGQVLRDGALLTNDSGDHLRIKASKEHVSTAYMQDATLFARGCYHLGNRHVPLQVAEGFLRFQTDYVLDDMLRGLGISIIHETATFEPENGAYAPGTGRSHGHSHGQGGEHNHGHESRHEHEHAH